MAGAGPALTCIDTGEQAPGPGQGGEGALLGAPDADQATGAPLAAEQLHPGAGDHAPDRKSQQVDRLLLAEGRFDVAAQQFRRLSHRGQPQPQGQVWQQQGLAAVGQAALEAIEHLGCVEQPMHQHQGGMGPGLQRWLGL